MKQSTNFLRQTINNSKKAALIITLFLTLGISYSFASNPDEIRTDIKVAFQNNFRNAHILSSEVHKHFTKLTFSMDNSIFFAFYTDDGELLALTHNILSSQLPANLRSDLKNNYSGYWITELFELTGDGQNAYYISLENADMKLTLRSTGDDNWEVYEKTAKK